jgi:CheY-like chemotaxis protein
MDGKGTLSIRAEELKGSRMGIEITDQGCGMSKEVMEQAIEPFFTTRPPGKGSGLGLSMAYGTVRDHHGTLTLSSQEAIGTTVRLEFPTLSPNGEGTFESQFQRHEHQTNTIRRRPLKEGIRIMLVDDDDDVRAVIGNMLTVEGCIVAPVSSGDKALEIYETEKTSFDLIVLDRMMPGISGEETFMELRKHSPELPILMYSGLAMDMEKNVLKGQPFTTFLQKPFSQEMLFSCITKLLINHE